MELILLFFFTRKISKIIKEKGHKSGWFVLLTVVLILIGETLGALTGGVLLTLMDAGDAGIAVGYGLALIGATLGGTTAYLIAKSVRSLQVEYSGSTFPQAFGDRTRNSSAIPISLGPPSRTTPMSTTKKIFIALGTVVCAIVMMFVVLIAVAFYLARGKGWPQEEKAKEAEGHEFAKMTDQEGCMKEGLVRAQAMTLFNKKLNTLNRAFVKECLKSSRSTPRFCENVPHRSSLSATDWPHEQCEKVNMTRHWLHMGLY